ncbi:MAG: hypothetical protein JNG85_15810 [Spirochaetaceae bacterium]|nr:hypothetical protein [Spirochaetaceae bacterium]
MPAPVPAPVPAPALLEAARAARSALVEFLAEEDESLLEDYAAGREPTAERLRAALRASTLARRAIPVLCGSAFEGASAALLLDAVLDYLPEPAEAGCPEGLPAGSGERRLPLPDEAFSALVFKTQADPHFGRLSWARIWSGRLAAGDRVLEAGSDRTLRVQKLFSIQAASLEEIASAGAGDIVALAFGSPAGRSGQGGGAQTERRPGGTGSSLCDPARPILYEPIVFEEPIVALALEPRSRADEGPLLAALAALVEEDPSLRLREDRETGRATLAGMGELHLEVALERLKGDFGVAVRAGAPEVAYKECLRRPGGGRVEFDRDNNGDILRATVGLSLEPGPRGSGLVFEAAPGLKAAAPVLQAMRRGVEAALSAGPARGLPVVDTRVRIEELGLPQGRKTELAAEIAASLAAREGLSAAGTLVLEPWMRIELSLPEEFLGEAAAVLAGRSGRVESIADSGGGKSLEAAAPLRLLFGLAGQLRSATAGRTELQVRFLRYEAAPPDFSGKRP